MSSKERIFFFIIMSATRQGSILCTQRNHSPGVKQMEREADHLPLARDADMYTQSFTLLHSDDDTYYNNRLANYFDLFLPSQYAQKFPFIYFLLLLPLSSFSTFPSFIIPLFTSFVLFHSVFSFCFFRFCLFFSSFFVSVCFSYFFPFFFPFILLASASFCSYLLSFPSCDTASPNSKQQ